MVDDARPPIVRHSALSPFSARLSFRAERDSHAVNNVPSQMIVLHDRTMGQFVPIVKDNVSRDASKISIHYGRMSVWPEEAAFNDELCARIQRLRVERDWSQQQMAAAIGVPHERYKKYETRSPMPCYLVPRFAQIVDRSIAYILTGKDEYASANRVRRLVRTGTDG
tara:strand:+ start:2364 stop:2864 length:501 start_codon:yes stop_codon:yes gene_type:complete